MKGQRAPHLVEVKSIQTNIFDENASHVQTELNWPAYTFLRQLRRMWNLS